MVNSRKKLLIIAPAIDPQDVGEAYVGYKWIEKLANDYDLTILTLKKTGHSDISHLFPNSIVQIWNEIKFFSRFERFNSMFKPWYFKFYFNARSWLKKALKNGEIFDLALQITPMAMRYPCPVVGLGIPYVIGPLGGGLPNLEGFAEELGKAPWFTKLRRFDKYRLRFDPVIRKSYKNARLIIASIPQVKETITQSGIQTQTIVINELGTENIFQADKKGSGKLRCLFVGRVIRTKGVRDLVRAVKALKNEANNIQFDVIGDGEDLALCVEEAKKLKVDHLINFHGKLDRSVVSSFYEKADLFVFPSFREPTGGVIIEAMSYGIPQIVADFGGPASIVTDETGIKILPKDAGSYPEEIAQAIQKLASDRNLREQMSAASLANIEENYIWKNKIKNVSQVLDKLIDGVHH